MAKIWLIVHDSSVDPHGDASFDAGYHTVPIEAFSTAEDAQEAMVYHQIMNKDSYGGPRVVELDLDPPRSADVPLDSANWYIDDESRRRLRALDVLTTGDLFRLSPDDLSVDGDATVRDDIVRAVSCWHVPLPAPWADAVAKYDADDELLDSGCGVDAPPAEDEDEPDE